MVNSKKKRRKDRLVYMLGLVGVLCLGSAAASFMGAFKRAEKTPMASGQGVEARGRNEPVVDRAAIESVKVESAPTPAPTPEVAVADVPTADAYYPLEVGRYWIYESEDAKSGTRTIVERRIVRRERRSDQDLFYFSDGIVAYRQDDKIFEMGSEGGVNVIPLGSDPYVYWSEGLHIEKQVGAKDTVMMIGRQRYQNCVQIITRFRPRDQSEQALSAYASYYARGIGLVGREIWPPVPGGTPNKMLTDYGPQKL